MCNKVQIFWNNIKNQNIIHGEIKSRLNLGNVCFHSVQNLTSSSVTFQNIKIKIQRILILPLVWYGCETWSLVLGEERRLRSTCIMGTGSFPGVKCG